MQLGAERDIGIAELDAAEGVRGIKATFAEARQAVVGHGRAHLAFIIGGMNDPLKRGGCFASVGGSGVQAEKRLLQVETLGRTVHDLPVMQVAAPAERDDARADAAERQANLAQMILIVSLKRGECIAV